MQAKHIKGTISLCAALIAGVALVAASGAGAAKARTAQIDVSTTSAVVHYLRSIHVNPKGAVIQRGARNYAGPNCPGKRWACASTKHTVVQIAKRGGQNRFVCKSSKCVVVQISGASHGVYVSGRRFASTAAPNKGGGNSGVCLKNGSGSPSGTGQICTINQSGSGPNKAVVWENSQKMAGLTTSLTYTATITQTATGGSSSQGNTACVTQNINLDGSTTGLKGKSVTAKLEAHQSVSITQDSSGFGPNTAANAAVLSGTTAICDTNNTLGQNQTLTSTVNGTASITQNENAADNGPNLSLDIEQNQNPLGVGTGANTAMFHQDNTLTAVANKPSGGGAVSQTQSSPNGGILADLDQDSTGVNTADATQTETQCEDAHDNNVVTCDTDLQDPPAYTLTQTQYGPLRKGTGDSAQTGGNPGNSFIVTQDSKQDNDTGTTQSNTIQGDCSTSASATCTVNQHTNINGSESNNTASGSSVDISTKCNGDSCVTFNGPQIAVTNTDVAESGVGGMRAGVGTGSIGVSGIPAGSSITAAFLYWNGPTNSADPAVNAAVTFNGTSVTGTNIGISGDNNWGFQNSQSYRADVTSLVPGNGTYSLANFVKAGADINGVALMVFYKDTDSSNDRNVTLWNGNDSNCLTGGTPENWNETITGVAYNGGSASLDFIVGDGQAVFDDNEVDINGLSFIPEGARFSGDSVPPNLANGLWDVKPVNGLESFLTTASPTDLNLTMTTGSGFDCLSLVVAAANVPVSGPIILAPTAAPTTAVRTPTGVTAQAPSVAAGSAGAAR